MDLAQILYITLMHATELCNMLSDFATLTSDEQ